MSALPAGDDVNKFAIEDRLVFPQRPSDYNTFRKSLMYPYDRGDLTSIDSSKQEHEVSLQGRLPFFGFYYKYIKVHLNGYLHFGGAPSGYSFPIRFPLRPEDTIRDKDPALIAPWLSFQSMVRHIPGERRHSTTVTLRCSRKRKLISVYLNSQSPGFTFDCSGLESTAIATPKDGWRGGPWKTFGRE